MARKANKSKIMPLRITPELLNRLKAQAKRENRTLADMMRVILSQGVALRIATIDTR